MLYVPAQLMSCGVKGGVRGGGVQVVRSARGARPAPRPARPAAPAPAPPAMPAPTLTPAPHTGKPRYLASLFL